MFACLDFFAQYCCAAESSAYLDYGDTLVTNALSKDSRNRVDESMQLRSVFLSVTPIEINPVVNHTHGVSAASRSTASLMIDQLADLSGKKPVFHQGSAADVRKGRAITRSWYWAKDQNVAPQTTAKGPNDLLAMVDVDYYVDMPKFLSRSFVPVVLYTFQPGSVSKDLGEYKYTFRPDGQVVYSVAGGGEYVHLVWNYAGDCVGVRRTFLGITIAYSTYSVERKVLDPDHQLVLLAPLRKYRWFKAWLAARRLEARELSRLNVVEGEFARLLVNHSDRMEVHTGKVGGYLKSVTLASVDDAIASAVRTSKVKITLSTVKSKMGETVSNMGRKFPGAEILLEYHLAGSKPTGEVISTLEGVRDYQWVENVEDLDEDAKPGMVAFMQPIVDGAFVPENTVNNDKRMVKKRVTELANEAVLTPFVKGTIDEFVNLFVGSHRHQLHPVEISEVYERQARPTQQRILDAAENELPKRQADMFAKREAYQKPGDPRGITTINGCDKRDYSQYTYAMAGVIKEMPWYAFGKSPRDISARVVTICEGAETHVDSTDFSRMDGRVSNVARYLERVLALALFDPCYADQLGELMRSQHSLKSRTRNGVSFETGLSRLSGSPETSLFNTVLSAFTAFLAMRMTPRNGKFMVASEAWRRLGVYGGDDGLTPDLNRATQEKAARMVGQLMTLDRTRRYDRGVMFLSRCYGPDVWVGDDNNCCDIRRALAKFHVTVNLSSAVTPSIKLQEKAYAMSLTDAHTPVIGPLVTKVLSLYPKRKYENLLGIWNSDIEASAHYPNVEAPWMLDLLEEQLPTFDMEGYHSWLCGADRTGILEPPLFCLPTEVEPLKATETDQLRVNGDFVPKEATATPTPQPKPRYRKVSKERGERQRRTNVEQGKPTTTRSRAPRGVVPPVRNSTSQ